MVRKWMLTTSRCGRALLQAECRARLVRFFFLIKGEPRAASTRILQESHEGTRALMMRILVCAPEGASACEPYQMRRHTEKKVVQKLKYLFRYVQVDIGIDSTIIQLRKKR